MLASSWSRTVVQVRVHLLGSLCLEVDDTLVTAADFPGRQGRIAFAYLVAHRYPVSRHDLADVIWSEDLPEAWERHLTAVLSKLRALLQRSGLGSDVLRTALGNHELRLPDGTEIDLESASRYFEDALTAYRQGNAEDALAAVDVAANLARRPFLPGEKGAWIDSQRDSLRVTLVRALELQAELHRDLGNHRDAVRLAQEAVTLEPFRESCYVQLMLSHLAEGNRAEGLRAYESCRSLLAEQLGIFPSAATEAAYQELLQAE